MKFICHLRVFSPPALARQLVIHRGAFRGLSSNGVIDHSLVETELDRGVEPLRMTAGDPQGQDGSSSS